MSKESPVVGIFCGDIHWSERPPISRSVEEDWFDVQKRYVDQLRAIQLKYNVPIFIAGDLFDKWNSSAHLIGRVLSWIDKMNIYAIPGNHDTPHHSHTELHRSAYWVLVEAGAIKHINPKETIEVGNIRVKGSPFGFDVEPPSDGSNSLTINVALIHDYIWVLGKSYVGADESKKAIEWKKKLKGYDAAFSGDNHQDFILQTNKPNLMNCGGFMRRNADEKERKPCIGLLHSDATIERHLLDVSADNFLDVDAFAGDAQVRDFDFDLEDLADRLKEMQSEKMDFARVVRRLLEKNSSLPSEAKKIVMRCISGGEK